MPSSPSPSPNTLLKPKAKRRLATLNFGMIFIVIGLVGAIGLAVVFGVSQMNAAPTTNTVVNGAPVTQGSAPQDLGMTGPESSGSAQDTDVVVSKTAVRTVATESPVQHATAAPQQAATYSGGGVSTASYAGGSTVPSSTAAEDERASQAREARRRQAQEAQEQLQRRRERVDLAMRSLGSVTVVDQHENNRVVASTGVSGDAAPDEATSEEAHEYAAPSGPTLALDTSIPVELTRSVDSTFGGQFEVRVTDDVRDETQRMILIPRDSRCYGNASAGGVDGQARLYGSFALCKLPDRERLVLDRFPAIDADGATGLKARVDDHGTGRHGRNSAAAMVPGMLVGSVVPGAAGITGAAASAASVAQASQVGRAMPGPTLSIDASAQHPRTFSILVTQDTAVHVYNSTPTTTSEVTP